jgi:hypothetical protein
MGPFKLLTLSVVIPNAHGVKRSKRFGTPLFRGRTAGVQITRSAVLHSRLE